MSSSRFSRLARGGLLAAFALSIGAASAPGGATAGPNHPAPSEINYPNFADSSTLSLNGTAGVVTSGGQRILRLTGGGYRQAGSAWSMDKIDLTKSFDTSFVAYLHYGHPGADGIAFLVQNFGPRALGGWGGGLGYRGISRSVAVEFDDFHNSPDTSANHIALVLRGNPDRHYAVSQSALPLFGKPFRARVVYDAPNTELRIYLKSTSPGATEQLMLDEPLDLRAVIGADQAYAGFTGATGSAVSKQDIYSWVLDTPGACTSSGRCRAAAVRAGRSVELSIPFASLGDPYVYGPLRTPLRRAGNRASAAGCDRRK
jgi:hypothetical protein